MVRLASVFSLASLVVFASATPVKRDLTTVEADIANISALITTFGAAVDAFNGTSDQATAVTTDISMLVSAFNTATTDAQATTPLTDDMDSLVLLGQIENTSPTLIGGLTQIAEKGADFTTANSSISDSVTTLGNSVSAFLAAIVAVTDTAVQPQAVQFQTTWNDAFADTLNDLAS